MNVNCRDIAKVLLQGMPIEGEDYINKLNEYVETIEAMPVEQLQVLRASYIFSRMARRDERQDLFQALVSNGLDYLAKYEGRIRDVERFCYTVAQHKWRDFWLKNKRHKLMLNGGWISLNEVVRAPSGEEIERQELVTSEVDFETRIVLKLDSQAVLNALPYRVKKSAIKKLNGQKLSSHDYERLARYREQNDTIQEVLRA